MTRIQIASLTFTALLPLCGCKTSTPPASPPPNPAISPNSQPTSSVSDAAKQEDERFRREVEVKRRKSHSADIDKTNAYRNYVP
jgi:hypothetical protein